MSKVRINDLARELEVKSRAILDALTHVGVTEKKTHSSSLEEDEAERVRQHFHRTGKNGAGAAKPESSEPKQKIDWSRVSKPGDVLKAIQQRKDEAAAVAQRSAVPPPQAQAVKPPAPQLLLQWLLPQRRPCRRRRRSWLVPRRIRRRLSRPPVHPASRQAPDKLGLAKLRLFSPGLTWVVPPRVAQANAVLLLRLLRRGASFPSLARSRGSWWRHHRPPRRSRPSRPPGQSSPNLLLRVRKSAQRQLHREPSSPLYRGIEVRPLAAQPSSAAVAAAPPRPQAPSRPPEVAAASPSGAPASQISEPVTPAVQAPPPPPPPAARRVIMPQTGPRPVYQAPPTSTRRAGCGDTQSERPAGAGWLHSARTADLRPWPPRRRTRCRRTRRRWVWIRSPSPGRTWGCA